MNINSVIQPETRFFINAFLYQKSKLIDRESIIIFFCDFFKIVEKWLPFIMQCYTLTN